jgi:HSP20 family protein
MSSLVRCGNMFDPMSVDFWAEADPLGVVRPQAEHVDWKETPDAHVFRVDLPGVKTEDAKVEVEDDGVLVISGERPAREEADGNKGEAWRHVERSSCRFQRRFRLPRGAKVDQVCAAAMEDGVVLTVTVPKEEVKKPQVKAIEISG